MFSTLGRLWIHAASKVPDADTIKAMEDFYREIYAVNGITDIKFPEHYPTSRLLGTYLSFFHILLLRTKISKIKALFEFFSLNIIRAAPLV